VNISSFLNRIWQLFGGGELQVVRRVLRLIQSSLKLSARTTRLKKSRNYFLHFAPRFSLQRKLGIYAHLGLISYPSYFSIMATVLPPPSKRQRTDASIRARDQQNIEEIPNDAGTLRLQFFDETTGLPIGQGPILVPVADANPKNLELLLNTLQGHVNVTSYHGARSAC